MRAILYISFFVNRQGKFFSVMYDKLKAAAVCGWISRSTI